MALLVGEEEFRSKVEEPLKAIIDQNKDPKALLIEGLKEAGLDEDPSKHTFKYLPQTSDAETKKNSEYFQNIWQTKLGVKVEILPSADFSDYLTKVQSQQFDIAMWLGADTTIYDFHDLFGKDNGNNNGKWANEEFETLLVQVQTKLIMLNSEYLLKWKNDNRRCSCSFILRTLSLSNRNMLRAYNYLCLVVLTN